MIPQNEAKTEDKPARGVKRERSPMDEETFTSRYKTRRIGDSDRTEIDLTDD